MYSGWLNYTYDGIATNVMGTGDFWFTMILTVTILLIPVVAERFYVIDTRPTLNDKVRLKQKVSKSRSRDSALILRRTSTMRRSMRASMRSGYAWAHSEGFGELITTGRNMKNQPGGAKTMTRPGAANAPPRSSGANGTGGGGLGVARAPPLKASPLVERREPERDIGPDGNDDDIITRAL